MSTSIRPLSISDAEEWRGLCREAFGSSTLQGDIEASFGRPGQTVWGVFNRSGMIATASELDFQSWFGGSALATSGIAAVTVRAEHRGQGLLRQLMREISEVARIRGALLTSLFPTSTTVYRRYGYEVIAELLTVRFPTHELASAGAYSNARRAHHSDAAQIAAVYDRWARQQNGPLTRVGAAFPAGSNILNRPGFQVTVVDRADGSIGGYAIWRCPSNFGIDSVLEIDEFVADDRESVFTLAAALGSFSAVAPIAQLRTSGMDVVRLILQSSQWELSQSVPYMLAVLDPQVLGHLTFPSDMSLALSYSVAGVQNCLEINSGAGVCTQAEASSGRVLTHGGLALTLAGAQSSANLRSLDFLSGGDVNSDLQWDALFCRRQVHIRDHF